MKAVNKILAVAMVMISSLSIAQTSVHENAKSFPSANEGMVQHIIYLPKSADRGDNNKKVEVYVGKYMETDMCNNYNLLGEFDKKEVTGKNWLSYYTFSSKGDAMSTLMGCLDNTKQNKFVTGQKLLLDYNGNLPIVIYTPEGMEVRYRIFTADTQEYKAQEVRK